MKKHEDQVNNKSQESSVMNDLAQRKGFMNTEEMKKHLQHLQKTPIEEIDPDSIKDFSDVSIDTELPVRERLMAFLEQTNNPYAFMSGKTIVKISFANNGKTMKSCMEDYLSSVYKASG